jgi:FAD/FMN-containing dehydrogenase
MSRPVLPRDRIERVSAWGMNTHTVGYVYRPSGIDGLREVFEIARAQGRTVALRGAGRSYGDAALGRESVVLEITRMNRILAWDPQTGIATCEPGVTIRDLWQYTLGDGWWPAVVPGTMFPTLAGAAAMNIHGKNNFKVGTIGDQILSFELLLPSGELRTCSRTENTELFHAAIGGFGMLGVFTQITLRLKKVHSGYLRVTPIAVRDWAEMFAEFDARLERSDYLVGWIDGFAAGTGAGRGQLHQANYLAAGEDPHPAQSLRVENQELPDTLFGVLPKSVMWRLMKPFVNDFWMRGINAAKFTASRLKDKETHLTSHAGFAFLLDYVPHWKRAYEPGGLIQYQSFVPKESAPRVFSAQLALCQKHGLVPYLCVFKRHRPDPFLMTHAVDGYSLALDFKLTEANRSRLWTLASELDLLVVAAGGRFYFAKDSTLHPSRLAAYLIEERVQRFLALKAACDPEHLLQTDLYRRLFPAPPEEDRIRL